MNRVEFMEQLERLLSDIPENDRLDAIEYYNNYFDEAGPENESQVIRELGSPGRVAATIKADLNTSESSQSEATGSNYEEQNMPSRKEKGYHAPKQKRNIPWPLIIVLLIFASPVLLGVGAGLFGGIVGVFGALFGIAVAVIACGVAFIVGGVVLFAIGVARIFIFPSEGLIMIGVGSLLLALGIVLTILFIWCTFKWIPALFRGCVNLCQRLFHRGERRSEA